MKAPLNSEQNAALTLLARAQDNVFLTGAAGTGKSFLLRHFLREVQKEKCDAEYPILASTGAAAILVGGRTFHSFFALGILEGGVEATVERACANRRLVKRLRDTQGVVIDEISMLSGPTLRAAETIARKVRGSNLPWGGLRVIAVGDFAQLPPVNPFSQTKEWAFRDEVWERTAFVPAVLTEIMRSSGEGFLRVLNEVREGRVTPEVRDFLESRRPEEGSGDAADEFDGTRLFARKENVDLFNLRKLETIEGEPTCFATSYSGRDREVENFKKHAPIPELLHIKEGALIMLRQNDPERRWVNGSLGHVEEISDDKLLIRLLKGRLVEVEKADFTLLDADGQPVVTARNFPISLAWAVTIHKAQGSTLDRIRVDIRRLWEPGQAYVALSRASSADGLCVEGWDARSIFSDPEVREFHSRLERTLQIQPA